MPLPTLPSLHQNKMSFEPTASDSPTIRPNNLSLGQKFYRRISSLRPSKRPADPSSSPPTLPPETIRDIPPSSQPSRTSIPEPIKISHSSSSSSPRDLTTAGSIYDRKRSTKRTNRKPTREPTTQLHYASTYALDSSPIENYQSRDMTAERVATALERLAKQSKIFVLSTTEPDEITPKEATIPLIVNSLQQHVKDPKVVDRALTALRRLTVDPACRRRIGACGGIAAIVDAMRYHNARVRIQTQACLALANLAYHCPQNKDAFLLCNGLTVVVAALSLHKSVEHVQAWGCFAIRNLTNGISKEEHETSVASGAVEVLVNALELYPKSTVVQEQSLIALTNIANSSQEGMERIRFVGGLQALISCMQNNCRYAVLSEIALSFVSFLVEDNTNQKILGSDGGIEAITAILDQHRGHTSIAMKGCAAFRQLSFQKENRDLLGRCGAIRAIITALSDTAASSAEAATVLLKALSNSTYDNMANKTLAGRLGGMEATLKVMSAGGFLDEACVIEDGCRVLRNLTDGVFSNHRLLIRNRGVAIVLDAARTHGKEWCGVAEHSVAIFVNLLTNRAVLGQVQEGSGDLIEIAKSLRMVHDMNQNIAKQVEDLLSILEPSGEGVAMKGGEYSSRGSGWGEFSEQEEREENLTGSKSMSRGFPRDGDQLTRLQRLRSLPLPLGRVNRM